MNGTIIFNDAEELAKFLKAFTGCTDQFTVERYRDGDESYILTFTGGF